MFEILLSSLFSLGLIFLIASLLFHDIRIASIPVYLVIILISYWSLVTTNDAGPLPPTYDNGWLWVHIFVGKVFLGLSLIAASLAITCLWLVTVMRKPTSSPDIRNLEATAWRYLSLSFIFHSLMLIAGAVWAQDAWGRYWGWDPLESWAFATWLSIALALHSRITYRLHAVSGWIMISAVFVLAFFTFFGVPFVSIAPHKGAI